MAPVLPEITSVTSEALQAQIRRLLPSQQGFGSDLQATNVIVPIVDLTGIAQGTNVPIQLQEAYSFVDVTTYSATNGTTVVANSPGFYRLFGTISGYFGTGGFTASVDMSDGLSTKQVFLSSTPTFNQNQNYSTIYTQTVFLRAGDSCSIVSSGNAVTITASVRQIADVNGVIELPTGFNPQ